MDIHQKMVLPHVFNRRVFITVQIQMNLKMNYIFGTFIFRKNRWISGAFAQNFINSTRFSSFFNKFGPTILSNLKHLRFCDIHPNAVNEISAIAQTISSFNQLQALDIIGFDRPYSVARAEIELNLPMLKSIQLEDFYGVRRLTLNAPVQSIKLWNWHGAPGDLKVDFVHAESVESVIVSELSEIAVESLKNLKKLYFVYDDDSELNDSR